MTLDRRRLLRRATTGGVGLLLVRATHAAAQTAPAKVTIDNFAFRPATLTIAAGTTVTWINHDDIPHSIVCPALDLHSHAFDTDQNFAAAFDKPGSYDYSCGLHPHMKGKLVVS